MSKKSPCHGCEEKRSPTCHIDCPDYLDWANEKQRERDKRRDSRDATSYMIEQILKRKKQKNKERR